MLCLMFLREILLDVIHAGRYAQGRGCHGTDNYANKAPHVSMELPEDIRRNCQPSHSARELTSAKRGKDRRLILVLMISTRGT